MCKGGKRQPEATHMREGCYCCSLPDAVLAEEAQMLFRTDKKLLASLHQQEGL